jgi:hypothetical protein
MWKTVIYGLQGWCLGVRGAPSPITQACTPESTGTSLGSNDTRKTLASANDIS